jgi:hypothetical protein
MWGRRLRSPKDSTKSDLTDTLYGVTGSSKSMGIFGQVVVQPGTIRIRAWLLAVPPRADKSLGAFV